MEILYYIFGIFGILYYIFGISLYYILHRQSFILTQNLVFSQSSAFPNDWYPHNKYFFQPYFREQH